jgi:hypothetical protein
MPKPGLYYLHRHFKPAVHCAIYAPRRINAEAHGGRWRSRPSSSRLRRPGPMPSQGCTMLERFSTSPAPVGNTSRNLLFGQRSFHLRRVLTTSGAISTSRSPVSDFGWPILFVGTLSGRSASTWGGPHLPSVESLGCGDRNPKFVGPDFQIRHD